MRVLLSNKDVFSIIDIGKCCEEFLDKQLDNRPFITVAYSPNNQNHRQFNVYVYFKMEIHEWLLFNNALDYCFEVEGSDIIEWGYDMNWYINIPNKDIALLFKLTWL
jgi:hypothetical protein